MFSDHPQILPGSVQAFQRSFTGRQTLWSWTSRWLLIHQRAWLSQCECDQRHPPHHYNLHIQPVCGGQDYHNYHIRYLGVQDAKYVWSVVDAPSGRERSHRVYTFSQRHLFGDVIDAASSSLVTDILNDVEDSTIWLPLVEYLCSNTTFITAANSPPFSAHTAWQQSI